MGTTRLDGLVLGTNNIARAAAQVEATTGVRLLEVGPDAGHGVRDLACSLGGGAFLSVTARDLLQDAPPKNAELVSMRDTRLIVWAVRTWDIDASVAALRGIGLDPGDPFTMTREAPSGRTLRYRQTRPFAEQHGGTLPILIHWEGETGALMPGAPELHLAAVRIVTPDRPTILQAMTALELEQTFPIIVDEGPTPGLMARVEGPDGVMTI